MSALEDFKAQHKEQPASSALAEFKAIQADPYNPTHGMSQFEKLMAGGAGGVVNVGKQVGNMLGLVSDEEIAEDKRLRAALDDTTAGMIGAFGGETLALAPLGVVGAGARAAHGASKGWNLAKTLAAASGEGAAAGAIVADPNDRKTGAMLGGAAGGILGSAGELLKKTMGRGLATKSDEAESLTKMIEASTGKRPFIPLVQAVGDESDATSSAVANFMQAAALTPSGGAKMRRQGKALEEDAYEAALRDAFPGEADDVASVLRGSGGDVSKALDVGAGRQTTGSITEGQRALMESMGDDAGEVFKHTGQLDDTQQVLRQAGRNTAKGQYSSKQLIRAGEDSVRKQDRAAKALDPEALDLPISKAPFRKLATVMDNVFGVDIGTSTNPARDVYRNIRKGKMRAVPGLGSILTSRRLQNFLMGDTGWQRKIKKAVDSGNTKAIEQVMAAFRRSVPVQPISSEEEYNAT